MSKQIDIVFEQEPYGGKDRPEGPRFVEVEIEGRSIRFGEWVKIRGGFLAIRFSIEDVADALAEAEAIEEGERQDAG